MGKEETLLKLKEAEAQIRGMKEAAERDRERVLREARREGLEILDTVREEAEARHREILAAAEAAVHGEREEILGKGREEAARLAARGKSNLDKAVDLVVEKFRGAMRA